MESRRRNANASRAYRARVKLDPVKLERLRKWGRDWQAKFRKQNPERSKELKRKCPSYGLSIKKKWMKRIKDRDGAVCARCGSKDNLTLQHKIPKCIGGKYSYDNLEILCLKCNMNDYHELVKKALKFYFDNQ